MMPPFGRLTTNMKVVLVVTALLLPLEAILAAGASHPIVLKLERHNQLPGGEVAEFPVNGAGRLMLGAPFLTNLQLGNPPQNFSLIIDTGSSITWVPCQTSSGASVGTTDAILLKTDDARCNKSSNMCIYDLLYGSGPTASTTTGYYVSELVHLHGLSVPASITFGCSTSFEGKLAGSSAGILGIGPNQVSFISQLNTFGASGMVFTLCMGSSNTGILAFGEAAEGGLVYTPILQSKNYYTVNLEGIAVNGEKLSIDSSVLRQSSEQYTFVDSGTTNVFLADGAFDPFVNAIRNAAPPFARQTYGENNEQCFLLTDVSIDIAFPSVELYFAGGAKMMLQPRNYLRYAGQSTYCIAWLKNTDTQVTILGDVVLVDKLIVHDMENMRLGWKDYNCSLPVNVTRTHGKKKSNSVKAAHIISTPVVVATMLMFCALSHI